ncbi:MAG: DUF5414 family protein [Chlamydiales bacterium]|nr:DUF5414 family protein [Chlamydiales bacterium]
MLDEKALLHLENTLKRIFAMKITRSTFRELQNLILSLSGGNQNFTQDLYESLLVGNAKEGLLAGSKSHDLFKNIAHQFSVLIRLAKEVFERGEFINIITSDTINNQDDVALLNRIRRIDGDEFLFISDPASTLHILQHFQGRLQDLEKTPEGKKQLNHMKKDLLTLSDKLHKMANAL